MDREEIRTKVMSAISNLVDNVKNEQDDSEAGDSSISENEIIGDFGLDSLEMIALAEVLERQFNLGYATIGNVQNLTVGELCDKVVEHVEKLC